MKTVDPAPTAAHEGYDRHDPQTRRIEFALTLAGLATFTLLYSTQAILPYFTRSYGVSASESALSVSLATLGLGLGMLIAAPISERIGRTKMIHISLFSSSIIGLIVAVLPSWELFLGARFLQGFALAGLPAVAAVYLREEISRASVATVTGIYIFGTTLGGLSGRLLSTWLVTLAETLDLPDTPYFSLAGEHLALFGTALLSLICAIACRILLPASRGFRPQRTTLRQLPRVYAAPFKDPVLIGLYVMAFLMMGTFVGMFNTLGFRLEGAPFYLPIALVGLIYLCYPVAGTASMLAGRLADRFGVRSVMPLGAVVALLGVGVAWFDWLPTIILGIVILASGFFWVHAVATAWVATRATAGVGHAAQAASMYMFFYYAGSSIGGNVIPRAWEIAGWDGATIIAVVLLVAAVVVAFGLRASKPPVRSDAAAA